MKRRITIFLLILLSLTHFKTLVAEETRRAFTREPLPAELQDILLATPEVIRPSDYPALKKWIDDVKMGLENTVRLSRPEFSVSDLSLFGTLEIERDQLENFEQRCGEVRAGYFWLENKMKVFRVLLKMTEEIIPLASDDPEIATAKAVATLFQTLLMYRTEIVELERSLNSLDALEATYYWNLPKEDLVETAFSFLNPKVLDFETDSFIYPGLNWSRESAEPLEEYQMIKKLPYYKHGGLNFTFREGVRSLCLDQYYFRLVGDVSYSYERIPEDASVTESQETKKKRKLTLHGHILETQSLRLFQSSESLKLLRLFLRQLRSSAVPSAKELKFEFVLRSMELFHALESCREVHADAKPQSETFCEQTRLQQRRNWHHYLDFETQMEQTRQSSYEHLLGRVLTGSEVRQIYWLSLFYASE